MNKKIILIGIVILVLVGVVLALFFFPKNGKISDAMKFKDEYESINNTVYHGNTIRSIDIDKDNPFIYTTEEELIQMMDDGKSFAVYFGFSECPWCRSILPSLIEVSKDLGIDEIYYLDVKNIRDSYTLDEEGNLKVIDEGSEGYKELLKRFDNVLDEYTITKDGKTVSANEKRIYAPNIVAVLNGKATNITTGISSKQTDAYMKLNDKMKKEMYNKIKCTIECLEEKSTVCEKKAC